MNPIESATLWEEEIIKKATQQNIPINGILELSPLCNMNCNMCFVRLSPEELRSQGHLRTAEEWLSLIEQMQRAGTLFVLITGGEPLLYPDFRKVYLELKHRGMIITLNTNGTLIDEEWADFFARNTPRRINITLYGTCCETYKTVCHNENGYEKTIRAIQLLKERNVDVKINGSIVPANCEECEEIVRTARRLDTAWKLDTYMYPAARERSKPFNQQSRLTPKEAAKVRVRVMKEENTPEKFRDMSMRMLYRAVYTPPGEKVPGPVACRAGRSSFMINWQGQMQNCVMLKNPSVPVFETGFDAAWETIVEETAKITMSPKCSGCKLRAVCDTCAACAFHESGAYDKVPEYMCEYTKETLNYLVSEMKQIMPRFRRDKPESER